MAPRLAETFERYSKRPMSFNCLNLINQIQGTDLDFFLRLFPLGTGVGERQGQNRAGGGEGGVKRRSDCNSESRTPDCSGDRVLKKQS